MIYFISVQLAEFWQILETSHIFFLAGTLLKLDKGIKALLIKNIVFCSLKEFDAEV